MRELIRPTLFLLARLGLFSVVVAWIVGRSWQAIANIPPANCVATMEHHGWTLSHYLTWTKTERASSVAFRRFTPAFFSGNAPLGWSTETFPTNARYGNTFPPGSKWYNKAYRNFDSIDWGEVEAAWADVPMSYDNYLFRLPGFVIYWFDRPPAPQWRISLDHWLLITIFALFNGVLMWVYRKRGEAEHDPAGDQPPV